MPLHKDTHTSDQIGGVNVSFWLCCPRQSEAKGKPSFPNIMCNPTPSDHPNSRELKAAYPRLMLKMETKIKSRSCPIYFPMDIIPHVDGHEKETGQPAVHCVLYWWLLLHAIGRMFWKRPRSEVMWKQYGSESLLSSFLYNTAWCSREQSVDLNWWRWESENGYELGHQSM